MKIFWTSVSDSIAIEWPDNPLSWVVWIIGILLIGFLLFYWRSLNKPLGKKQLLFFLLLSLLTPVTAIFFGFKLILGVQLTPPGTMLDTAGETAMVFSAVPWFIAGGILGPLAGTLLGLASGLIRALWDTHDPFTILQTGALALLVSAAISQRFRTNGFKLLRRPLAAALFGIIIYLFIYLLTAPFSVNGWIVLRLDYMSSNLAAVLAAVAIELITAGILSQILVSLFRSEWGGRLPYIPSPAEKSLHARVFLNMLPFAGLLIAALSIGIWVIASRTTMKMLKAQMVASATSSSENIPYILDTGLDLIKRIAGDRRLTSTSIASQSKALEELINQAPYFTRLILVDGQGQPITSYPTRTSSEAAQSTAQLLATGDQANIQLALSQLPSQYYVLPSDGQQAAQVSFAVPILNAGEVVGVLVARTDLSNNPLAYPLLSSLNSLTSLNGSGMLLDEHENVLAHSESSQLSIYNPIADNAYFSDLVTADGTRSLAYYQPAYGSAWTVAFVVPAETIGKLAFDAAAPVLAITLILLTVGSIILWSALNPISKSLKELTADTKKIASGISLTENDTAEPFTTVANNVYADLEPGDDEIGQLRQAYLQMQQSIKKRLEDLNRLLRSSREVASNLDLDDAVQSVLESALSSGASVARIILPSTIMPQSEPTPSQMLLFSAGQSESETFTVDLYQDLDEQILAITRQQDQLSLPDLSDAKALRLSPNAQYPEALFAAAMRHDGQWFGALWVAFDRAHIFTTEEVNFLSSLATQAAIAVVNARIYLNAESERKRLAAILASSPDPILVTDRQNRLILANPSANQLLNLRLNAEKYFARTLMPEEGRPIEQVIKQKELLNLLREPPQHHQLVEITIKRGSIYVAAVSPLNIQNQPEGLICVLHNITRFKEIDTLKSEFVSTVSHDLRTPLSLVRGYATMLEMVGPLNEQQTGYVRKMVASIENMSRLVNNLLDLGRIEAGVGLQLEMISACEMAERVVGSLQIHANQKKIHMTTECQAPGGWMIEADAALLHQALHNLMENAIRFNRNEGSVRLKVYPQQEKIVFEVTDTGIGISPMDQAGLFSKFSRSTDQAASRQEGSGLGLAIVRSIAERHSGSVSVDSQLGKGSTFYLSIPIRQPR